MQEEKNSSIDGIVLPPGGGKALHVLGNPWTIKASREDTGGPIAVMEASFRPGSGAPAHVHRQHEEAFYILEGEFFFHLGTQTVIATVGTFVFVPRGVPHAFENVGTLPGRVLGMLTPGGYEQFFEELAQLPPGSPDPAKFQEIFEKYDQEVVELPTSVERK
jgi:mannose-6-phosphate isomerase-like protein (cupin superfamily)